MDAVTGAVQWSKDLRDASGLVAGAAVRGNALFVVQKDGDPDSTDGVAVYDLRTGELLPWSTDWTYESAALFRGQQTIAVAPNGALAMTTSGVREGGNDVDLGYAVFPPVTP